MSRRRGNRRGGNATGPKEEHKYFDVYFNDMAKTSFDIHLKNEFLQKELTKIADDIMLYEDPPKIPSEALEKSLHDLKARAKALEEGAKGDVVEDGVKGKEDIPVVQEVGKEASKSKEEMKDTENADKKVEEKGKEEEKDKEVEVTTVQREALTELAKFAEAHFALLIEQAENVLKAGKVNFDSLGFLFRKNEKIFSFDDGGKWSGEIQSTSVRESYTGRIFCITVNIIDTDGEGFHIAQRSVYVHEFDGVKELSALSVWRLDPETHKQLTERGKLFVKFGLGKHYMFYKGTIFRKDGWRATKYRADGRIMVYRNSGDAPGRSTLPDSQLYMCNPTVRGFSFYAKKWGEIHLENISPIVFNDQAFDQLVLDEGRKRMIKALVLHNEETFSDIISGKGGACIFLLHGPPGVGKTLTAEAVAELLRRPLYSVTTGELGTDAAKLEHNLQEILETARAWNSITLIDEAADHDIARNALVGIFLRLLEYHQGILILTTNRVSCFDDAFYSRITLSLSYTKLGDSARKEIWQTLTKAANIKDLDTTDLATYELNGRQIKNVIKVAQALAFEETSKSQPSMAHVKLAIQSTMAFQKDLEKVNR